MKKNDTLKKYILNKYGSVANFVKKENFSKQDLETVFQKSDIFYEIGIGIKVCGGLNIDAERLFCRNEILVLENESPENAVGPTNLSLDDAIKEEYAKLSPDERQKALDFANLILENGVVSPIQIN